MIRYLSCPLFILLAVFQASASNSTLSNGTEFPSWEKPLHFAHSYSGNGGAANADDNGPAPRLVFARHAGYSVLQLEVDAHGN
jgi:hypothetical protein